MAVSELFAFSVLLVALKFTIATANDEPWLRNAVASSPVPSDSSFVALESSIGERNQEFVERSENVGVGEIELIQEFSSNVEHVGTPKKDDGELEKQVERLMKEIEMQNMKRNRLGARASYVEQRIHSLSSKLEQLYKVNDEQENRIRKFESLLQVAEIELVKVEEETALRPQDLNQDEVVNVEEETALRPKYLNQEELMKGEEEGISLNSADLNQGKPVKVEEETALDCKGLNQSTRRDWLPGWLYAYFDHIQLSLTAYWNESWKIVMGLSIQKGLKTKAQVEDWIKLQTEMIRVDWVPILKEQWLAFVACLQSQVRSLTKIVINLFYSSMDYIAPQASKLHKHSVSFAQEWIPILKEQIMKSATHLIRYIQLLTATIMDIVCASWSFIAPHAQKAKSFAESYMLQSGTSLRYLLEKLYFTIGSCAIQVLHASGRLLDATISYHHQVQEWLKHHFD